MSEDLPYAVWSGTVLGMRAYVLSDGRRVFDQGDFARFFERLGEPGHDLSEADVAEFRSFRGGRGVPQ